MSLNRDTRFTRVERFVWRLGRALQDWAEARESGRRWLRRAER